MVGAFLTWIEWGGREQTQTALAIVYYSRWCGAEKIGYLMSMRPWEGVKNSTFHRKIRRKNLGPTSPSLFFLSFPSPSATPPVFLPSSSSFCLLFCLLLYFCVRCWRPSTFFSRARTEVQGWHSNICRTLVPNLLIPKHLMSYTYITVFKPKSLECTELPRVWPEFVSFG